MLNNLKVKISKKKSCIFLILKKVLFSKQFNYVSEFKELLI